MKKVIILLLFSCASLAQDISKTLENTISGVVTVAVYESDETNKSLGYRGDNLIDIAYAQALNLTGAVSSGSGFVIKADNKFYVISNAHVVESAKDKDGSLVVFSINRTKYRVKIVGGDTFYDIAVLEFLDTPGKEITPLSLRKEDARLGEKVFAIGNPLGEYPYTVTDGIISAKNRVRGSMTGKFGFLQSTATVIWGNSGGPLVDEKGEVIGVNSQIAFADTPSGGTLWQSQINFALESPIVQRIVTDVLTNDGFVKRAYVGVEVAKRYELRSVGYLGKTESKPITDHPVLTAVMADAPDKETLNSYLNCPIVAVNDVITRSTDEVLEQFEATKPNQKITITFKKEGAEKKVTIKTTELRDSHLETLGRFVLDDNQIELVALGDNVGMKLKASPATKITPVVEGKQMQGNNDDVKFILLGAGKASGTSKEMYRIKRLNDLGAALRLTASSGSCQFMILRPNDDPENVRMASRLFSGKETENKSCLWY